MLQNQLAAKRFMIFISEWNNLRVPQIIPITILNAFMWKHNVLLSNLLDFNFTFINFKEELLNWDPPQLLIVNGKHLHDDWLLQLGRFIGFLFQYPMIMIVHFLLVNVWWPAQLECIETLIVNEHVFLASILWVYRHFPNQIVCWYVINYHEIGIDVSHFLI